MADVLDADNFKEPVNETHAKIKTAVAKRNEEEFRRTWNAAIEAVAKHLDEMGEEERISIYVREMKK